MKRGKRFQHPTLTLYGALLAKSWSTVWSHKKLWIVAAVAGFANTGAVFNNVVNAFWRIQPADMVTMDTVREAFSAYPWLTGYVKSIITLDTAGLVTSVTASLVLVVAIAAGVVVAQQIILSHAHRQVRARKHITFDRLKKDLKHIHFWRILAVDLLTFLATSILLLLASLPLALLLGESAGVNGLVYFGFYLVLLPAGFVINTLGMFSLLNIAKHDAGIIDTLKKSWTVLKRDWVVAFEMAMILYVINLVASVLFIAILFVVALPATVFSVAALSVGSITLLGVVSALALLVITLLGLLFTGGMTMFNYSLWAHVLDRLEGKRIVPFFESVARKLAR